MMQARIFREFGPRLIALAAVLTVGWVVALPMQLWAQAGVTVKGTDADMANRLWDCAVSRAAFADRQLDKPRCISFTFDPPAEGIASAVLRVAVEPLGPTAGTDTLVVALPIEDERCAWVRGDMAGCAPLPVPLAGTLLIDLTNIDCAASDGATAEIEAALAAQLATGRLYLMVQDDTAVLSASLSLNAGDSPCPSLPTQPTTPTPSPTVTATTVVTPDVTITPTGPLTVTSVTTASVTAQPTPVPTATPAVVSLGPTESVEIAGLLLEMPGDWYDQTRGETFNGVAQRRSDLRATRPRGPRLAIVLHDENGATTDEATDGAAESDDLMALLDAEGEVGLLEPPAELQVAGFDAVSVGLWEIVEGATIHRRYVMVDVGDGRFYEFVLEAPESVWDESLPVLEAILASVQVAAE